MFLEFSHVVWNFFLIRTTTITTFTHTHMYTHTYTQHTHMYIYIYIQREREREREKEGRTESRKLLNTYRQIHTHISLVDKYDLMHCNNIYSINPNDSNEKTVGKFPSLSVRVICQRLRGWNEIGESSLLKWSRGSSHIYTYSAKLNPAAFIRLIDNRENDTHFWERGKYNSLQPLHQPKTTRAKSLKTIWRRQEARNTCKDKINN